MKFSGITLLLVALLTFSFSPNKQSDVSDCSTYFPLSVGMKWTTKSFNKKRKETGRSTMEVLEAKALDGGTTFVLKSVYDTGKKDEVNELDIEYYCKNNILTFNMDQFFSEMVKETEGMTVDVQTDGIELPNVLESGMKLNDASVKVTATLNGMQVLNVTVTVSDRIVEKFEKVTTEAGTYNCAKVTSKVTSKMAFMTRVTSSANWFSDKVGVVKTEEYDKNGKLASGTELVAYSE